MAFTILIIIYCKDEIYFSQNFFMVALFLGNSVINFRSINITIFIIATGFF